MFILYKYLNFTANKFNVFKITTFTLSNLDLAIKFGTK